MSGRKRFLIFVIVFLAVFLIGWCAKAQQLRVVGYYTKWSSCQMPPSKIDYRAFTHIIHFGGEPTTSATGGYFSCYAGSADSIYLLYGTPQGCTSNVQQNLRDSCTRHGIKLILCIGGESGNPSQMFNAIIADTVKQDIFIAAVSGWAWRHNYDGIDIDDEYFPTRNNNYTLTNRFLNHLRAELNRWPVRGLLTGAFPQWTYWDGWHTGTQPYIQASVANAVFDDIHMMEYGLAQQNSQSKVIGPNSALYDPCVNYTQWSIDKHGPKDLIASGVNPKIITSMTSFECFQWTSSTPAYCMPYTAVSGWQSFTGAYTFMQSNPGSYRYDSVSQTSFAVAGTTLWSFMDSASVAAERQYAIAIGIGGWGGYDIWRNWIPSIGKAPLINQLYSIFGSPGNIVVPPAMTNVIISSTVTDTIGQQVTFTDNLSMVADSIVYYRSAVGVTPVRVTSTTNTSTWTFYWTGVATGNYGSFTVAYKNGVPTNSNTITIPVYNVYIPPSPVQCYTKAQLDSACLAGQKSIVCPVCPAPIDTTGTAAHFFNQGWDALLNIIPNYIDTIPQSIRVLIPKPPIR
jgi:Glycosyl hydrolases family 18